MNWTSIYIKMKWKQQDEQRILEPQYQLNQDNYWGNEAVKPLDIFIMNKVIYPQQSACMYFFHNAFSSFSLTELFFSWIWEHVALKSNREEVWSVKVVSSIIITSLSPVTFNVKIGRLDTSSSTAISYLMQMQTTTLASQSGVRLLILVLLMRSVCTLLNYREVVINWPQNHWIGLSQGSKLNRTLIHYEQVASYHWIIKLKLGA